MEILSNLIWITVALALWGLWLVRGRSARSTPRSCGIAGQLTALATLTLILLPVISVSDDLHAAQNPAEVERTCVRSDQHLIRPDAVQPAPAALAIFISFLLLASPRTIAFLNPPSPAVRGPVAHVRVPVSRPPPIL